MDLHKTYEIRWRNFKGFKDTDWIKIKPITILLGPNNTGKTSFISPLLLMSQTISSRDLISPLITRGRLIDAGTYLDIAHRYNLKQPIQFGFRYHLHEQKAQLKPIGTYPPGIIEISFGYDNLLNKPVLLSQEILDIFNRSFLKMTRNNTGSYKLTGLDISKMNKFERKAIRKSGPRNFLFTPTTALYNCKHPA